MTRLFSRAHVRLWYAAGALVIAVPYALAAQQSVDADRALLAQERFVTPPPEVARLVTAPRQINATSATFSPHTTKGWASARSSARRTCIWAACRWTRGPIVPGS